MMLEMLMSWRKVPGVTPKHPQRVISGVINYSLAQPQIAGLTFHPARGGEFFLGDSKSVARSFGKQP